ncbi:hypothetical protein Taro_032585 [Colocasia esculenta]|uniref:Protein kinase domain-containing protein n=1 Tax=Colocasia esculenta TaxID=4460 RepID=A0A843VT06_COLES|nr:hypothetical protein [Colocasia esculenta]
MAGEAESPLHGATDREADLLQGGEDGKGLDSSPRRQEEDARVSSTRSHSALASDASFRSSGAWSSSSSSLASDVESDDGDAAYPWTQCEYEEIPSFRWIASPLRWWKPKKGSGLSGKNTAHATTATRDKEPGTLGGSWASETSARLVHFEGYRTFTLDELLSADGEVLGKYTYWTMYKSTLEDGSQVVVRRLRPMETAKDFVTEVNLLGKIRHSNLLAPRAYYYSPNRNGEKLLIFDHMPKGNLSEFLHARGNSPPIDWPTRMNIAIGVARGLHHLHTQGNMVHGNLSSVNVLLDYHVNPKVGAYGLSKLLTPAAANSSFMEINRISAYHAPELSNLSKVNTKTDVYSLGVIMLELLTGKSPRGLDKTQWVASITKVETTAQPGFRDTLKLALKCVDASPDVRPEMQKVLQQLEENQEIKSKFEKTTLSPTTKGGNKPNDAGAAAASTITTPSPPTAERTASPFKDDGVSPLTANNFVNDGKLPQACASENVISSPLASSASDAEAMPAPINSSKHKDENLTKMTPQGDLKDSEIPNPTQAEEITQNPFVNEELEALNPAKHITGLRMDTKSCNAVSQGRGASPLSSIDWATVDIQVHLHVPTSPPLISSDPDSGYQRYFQTLYDLAHRSPPLPCNVLEVQLNSMIMGLHSLGYPLDTWVKAANLVLVLAKKQEYIEQHVDDYKVHMEMQLKEFTSAITPAKEEITITQSDIAVLEHKQEELDETIGKLEDQLALLKTQRQEVVNSLTTARDVLAVAEAKVESISVRMNCLNQQYSAISNLRRAMLLKLPSLDEAFDSNFQEITKSERTASPFKDDGVRTPLTANNFVNDGKLPQACASENVISSPLASSASDAEAMPAPINSSKHKDENLTKMMPQGDLKDSEIPNPTQAEEITQNPFVNEELEALNPAEHITGLRMDMESCNAVSQGTGASPLSRIDWATVNIQVHLHVPTSPPLISSDPDSGYQRYFQTLYDLAHRSPPLPCNVLEVQLNSMIMGLHSLGYPLDTWVKAANLVLVLAKKLEYIEQHVDDYKVHMEMQLKEFTSAITPAKEEIIITQSDIAVLEHKQEELDETIVAEAKVEWIFVRMNCLNQQYSAISNLRRAMLLKLPSLDEAFDSNFQEIMTRKF